MEEKDLIKKLEETSLPEIELPSHKGRLKITLFNKYSHEKRRWEIFDIFRKAVPLGAVAVILLFLVFNNLIFPQYNLTKAKEIALKNSQINEWIERGATIKDIKIIKNRAYVLIQSIEEIKEEPGVAEKEAFGIPKIEEIKKEEFQVALAEINIKERKITKIEKIAPPVIPITEEEKEKIQEITQNSPEIQKNIPEEAEILSIKSYPPQLELIREGNSIQVLPEPESETKASVIYKFDKKQWEGKINLSEGKVEEVKFLGEIED